MIFEPDITPTRYRRPLDNILLDLNARWNLDLRQLHGEAAARLESTPSLVKRCSARLRYLFYRDVNLDALLADFNTRASTIFSGWIHKPRAESDVLASRSKSDSILHRKVIKGKLPLLDDNPRHSLLLCLDALLEPPFEQARASDSFRHPSLSHNFDSSRLPTSSTDPAATMRDYSKVAKPAAKLTTPLKNPSAVSRSSSKRQSETVDEATTTQKKSRTLDQFLDRKQAVEQRGADLASVDPLGISAPSVNNSVASLNGSNDTTVISDDTSTSFLSTQEVSDLFEDPLIKQSIDSFDSGYESGPSTSLRLRVS
jgi:hypothetical protein